MNSVDSGMQGIAMTAVATMDALFSASLRLLAHEVLRDWGTSEASANDGHLSSQ